MFSAFTLEPLQVYNNVLYVLYTCLSALFSGFHAGHNFCPNYLPYVLFHHGSTTYPHSLRFIPIYLWVHPSTIPFGCTFPSSFLIHYMSTLSFCFLDFSDSNLYPHNLSDVIYSAFLMLFDYFIFMFLYYSYCSYALLYDPSWIVGKLRKPSLVVSHGLMIVTVYW